MSLTIHIKMMSGDLVEVSVKEDVTFSTLYQDVYRALPEDVRPRAEWQLTLTRQTSDGEYEEVPDTMERANPQEGEMFCGMIDNHMVATGCGKSADAYDEDADATTPDEYLYELQLFWIMSEKEDGTGGYSVCEIPFLCHDPTGRYYLTTNVEGRWIGRKEDEFSFRFTEKGDGFATFEEMLDVCLTNLDEYPNRTKVYLKRRLMRTFDPETTEEWEEEEQEEQEEQDMRHWG